MKYYKVVDATLSLFPEEYINRIGLDDRGIQYIFVVSLTGRTDIFTKEEMVEVSEEEWLYQELIDRLEK